MGFWGSCYRAFLQFLPTFSPNYPDVPQRPLPVGSNLPDVPQRPLPVGTKFRYDDKNFDDKKFDDLTWCGYGSEWKSCWSNTTRDCWITNGEKQYDINTDYESDKPPGRTLEFNLTVDRNDLSPDGKLKSANGGDGMAFNESYPGPLIEACWGDEIVVHVTNNIGDMGTTTHFHGVRQLNTNNADGVNGVTQCGITPSKTYTYRFNATQYGHTWYHSHFSLQYSNGLAGKLLIHGPSSASWDVDLGTIFVSDWVQGSTFLEYHNNLQVPFKAHENSIVLDGKGFDECRKLDGDKGWDCDCQQNTTNMFKGTFQKGKKHLLRLINTSVETTFIFSIDNHYLQIVAADFVAVEPYPPPTGPSLTHIYISIGQRYTVIVEAIPDCHEDPKSCPTDGLYWIRTKPAKSCTGLPDPICEKTGVIRYDDSNPGTPHSPKWSDLPTDCQDMPLSDLIPKVSWYVPKPTDKNHVLDIQALITKDKCHGWKAGWLGCFDWYFDRKNPKKHSAPLWLDLNNPAIQNPGSTDSLGPKQSVVELTPVTDKSTGIKWNYLVIECFIKWPWPLPELFKLGKIRIPVYHPMHLHGHDFVILKEAAGEEYHKGDWDKWNYVNPTRRDTALLHSNGYLAIAFKSDNPGAWLLHCHISWHASSGLGVQLVESKDDILNTIGHAAVEYANETCTNWTIWRADHPKLFTQEDSGV